MRHACSLVVLSLRHLSLGVWIILSLFVISGGALLINRDHPSENLQMWVFSPEHEAMYKPIVDDLQANTQVAEKPIDLILLSKEAIKSKTMSGFLGGLPTADLVEIERAQIGQFFQGPQNAIGFRDLTDRLKDEGLLEQINAPSLAPWSVHGRIYGLPHDVHPVMLAYRADLTEAAGIDLTQATTWTKFFELLKPMMTDNDGDGRPDHYPLSLWITQQDNLELLLLQGGGRLFDDEGVPTLNTKTNAQLLAEIISWCAGTTPLVTDIDEFSAAGHKSRVDGDAIAYLCPDWMCSVWKMHVPGIAGKMKLMPLPAFEEGGRRTSVRGGTMLGIPKTTQNFEQSWNTAVELYTAPKVARELYRSVDIISPIRSLWDDPVYAEPDPFFMNQPKGLMFIDLAPDIPVRTSSPYNQNATLEIRDSSITVLNWANNQSEWTRDQLIEQVRKQLQRAQDAIERQMSRNAFTGVESQ